MEEPEPGVRRLCCSSRRLVDDRAEGVPLVGVEVGVYIRGEAPGCAGDTPVAGNSDGICIILLCSGVPGK